MLGILSREAALAKARENFLDLILIAPDGKPPVCKIADFGKFRYELEKKEKEARKGKKVGAVKELKISPKIDGHDLLVRIKRTKEFLEKGHKVKITMVFRGREISHIDIGVNILNRLTEEVKDFGFPEENARLLGKNMILTFAPGKKK